MRQPSSHPALRNSLSAAVVIMVLGSANAAAQAWRHTEGPSARWLVVFTYLFFLVTALLLLRVGYRSTRLTGRLNAGALAGAMTGAPPATLLAIAANLQTIARQRTGTEIVSYFFAVLLLAAAGALVGAIISLPGALVARSRYRAEHAMELAALAAERAAHQEREREARALRKRQTKSHVPWPTVLLAIAALLLIAFVPGLAAGWAYDTVLKWQGLVIAAGALAAGAALLAVSNRAGWLGYAFDWLGVALMFAGALLGVVELSGYFLGLLTGGAAFVYMWRLFGRVMRGDSPPLAERPERPPVLFRNDSEAIVIYPSRRKLALHAAFAAGMALIASALAILLRGAGPDLVVALGAFAVGGLIGLIPDAVRLLVRWPALIVNHDGIIDLASAGFMGFGLIPWHEITAAFNAGTLRGGAFPELAIVPVSFGRLLSHQPLLKRPFLRLGSALGGGMIFIGSLFLSAPPYEVARRINAYVKSHAPAGYAEPDEDEEQEQDERAYAGDNERAQQ